MDWKALHVSDDLLHDSHILAWHKHHLVYDQVFKQPVRLSVDYNSRFRNLKISEAVITCFKGVCFKDIVAIIRNEGVER